MAIKKTLALGIFSLLLVLLLSLGIWQLQRGLDKAEIVQQANRTETGYQALGEIPSDFTHLAYQQVKLQGQWLAERQFLLDNRTHQGQAGYEVLTPFELSSGQILLINRGWLAKTEPTQLEQLTHTLKDSHQPVGTLYAPKKGFSLGEALLPNETDWPRVTLYLDMPALSQALAAPLLPVMLVITEPQSYSYQATWQPIVMTPARHYAYAAQWFTLAIALWILGFRHADIFLDA